MTGAELRDVLSRWGLTQAEFGRLVGYPAPTVNRYVRGTLPVPTALTALVAVLRQVEAEGGDAARLLRAALCRDAGVVGRVAGSAAPA